MSNWRKRAAGIFLALVLALCGFGAQAKAAGYYTDIIVKQNPTKMVYAQYDTLDLSGMVLHGVRSYDDGSTTTNFVDYKIVMTNYSPKTLNTLGTVKVELQASLTGKSGSSEIFTTYLYVTVKPALWLKTLTFNSLPAKRDYVQGETLDMTGLKATAVYAYPDGSTKTADVTKECYLQPKTATGTGTQTVTIYTDQPDEDGSLGSHSTTYTLNVTAATDGTPVFKTTSLPEAVAGEAYTATIKATSTAAVEFSVYYNPGKKNQFDDTGLKLSAKGQLTGTPKKAGSYTFTVCASNASGESYKQYTLTVTEKEVTSEYNLFVAGTGVNADNAGDILGDGTLRYDPALNTLYMENCVLLHYGTDSEGNLYGIRYAGAALVLSLTGDNTVALTETEKDALLLGIGAAGNLTLEGTGTLSLEISGVNGLGLYAGQNLILNGGRLRVDLGQSEKKLNGLEAGEALRFHNGEMTVNASYGASAVTAGSGILVDEGFSVYAGEDMPGELMEDTAALRAIGVKTGAFLAIYLAEESGETPAPTETPTEAPGKDDKLEKEPLATVASAPTPEVTAAPEAPSAALPVGLLVGFIIVGVLLLAACIVIPILIVKVVKKNNRRYHHGGRR